MLDKKNGYMLFENLDRTTSIVVPYPSKDSGALDSEYTIETANNASGAVVGQKKGRTLDKITLSWNYMLPETWYELQNWLEENFMFCCTFFNYRLGKKQTREFYLGNVSQKAYKLSGSILGKQDVDFLTGCQINIIDTGR